VAAFAGACGVEPPAILVDKLVSGGSVSGFAVFGSGSTHNRASVSIFDDKGLQCRDGRIRLGGKMRLEIVLSFRPA
jgi:hypothetical protein